MRMWWRLTYTPSGFEPFGKLELQQMASSNHSSNYAAAQSSRLSRNTAANSTKAHTK